MSQKTSVTSTGTSASIPLKDSEMTQKTFNKIALRLLPFLVLCYFAAFLDRVNVGFAALTMREDIGLSATAFGLGSGIFFISYFIFEVPSNLMLARVGARRWIARIMITWGLLSACTAFVWDAKSFLALRFLLGAAEAGFYPGILYYLTQWFPNKRRAQIVGFLLLSNPLATIIGGPVSGLILSGGAHSGLEGWQWLFILEAIPAVILGVIVLLRLPEKVEDVSWLTQQEKKTARKVLDEDFSVRQHKSSVEVSRIFFHPLVLSLALIFLGISMTNATVNFWLPQLIKSAGFSFIATGFLSVIPYVAAVIALLWWGKRSDRKNERVFHIVVPLVLAIAGIAITAFSKGALLNIVGLTMASAGLFAVLPVFWTLPPLFMVGPAAAGGIAVINSIGNLGGFFGPTAMGYVKDLTGDFGQGLLVNVLMLSISLITMLLFASQTGLRNRIITDKNAITKNN
ncbi:MFS transporter [Kosakonia quasisacchari]|uniref:MFS transporter n=1 Tax=Kosakonia quasisacchari TaxID=2529380 RepID=A0A4R0GJC8_9ENTR|nr:MFS transporter [Kosakonia quasisacchari]TCB96413.1 MFS transporter [Kosakonia quasisacchari]